MRHCAGCREGRYVMARPRPNPGAHEVVGRPICKLGTNNEALSYNQRTSQVQGKRKERRIKSREAERPSLTCNFIFSVK